AADPRPFRRLRDPLLPGAERVARVAGGDARRPDAGAEAPAHAGRPATPARRPPPGSARIAPDARKARPRFTTLVLHVRRESAGRGGRRRRADGCRGADPAESGRGSEGSRLAGDTDTAADGLDQPPYA